MRYCLPGCPVPLNRARFNGRRVYDDQRNLKIYLKQLLTNQHNCPKMFSGPLLLDVTFYMPMPKKAHNAEGRYHIFRPDLDNLLKMVCDVCNEVLFNDDCTIAKIECKKVYSEDPRTEFYIEELKNCQRNL